jgi:hypothetical protein
MRAGVTSADCSRPLDGQLAYCERCGRLAAGRFGLPTRPSSRSLARWPDDRPNRHLVRGRVTRVWIRHPRRAVALRS